MKRILKFRTYDKFDESMLYFDIVNSRQYDQDEMETWEIMQFTDLLDKNGKDIYEGDILRDRDGMKLQVMYKQEGARFIMKSLKNKMEFSFAGITYLSILGNIYENPELLNK